MVTYIIRWKPQGSSKPNTLKQPVFCLFSIGKRTHSQATPLNFNHQTKKHGSVFPGWRYICGYFPALKIVYTLIIRKGVDFQPAMLDDFISHAIQTNLLEIRAFCKNCSGNHRSFAPLYLPAHPEKSPVNHMFDAKSASKKWVICLILLTFPSQLLSYYLIYIRCVCVGVLPSIFVKTFSFRVTTQTKQDSVVITGLIFVPSASARFWFFSRHFCSSSVAILERHFSAALPRRGAFILRVINIVLWRPVTICFQVDKINMSSNFTLWSAN